MLIKSVSGVCSGCIHLVALACAAASMYFFLGSSIEFVLGALVMLGAAAALEIIAVIVNDDTMAHS